MPFGKVDDLSFGDDHSDDFGQLWSGPHEESSWRFRRICPGSCGFCADHSPGLPVAACSGGATDSARLILTFLFHLSYHC